MKTAPISLTLASCTRLSTSFSISCVREIIFWEKSCRYCSNWNNQVSLPWHNQVDSGHILRLPQWEDRYLGSHSGKIDTQAPTVGKYLVSHSGQILRLPQWVDAQAPQWEDTKAPTVGRHSGSHSGQILRLTQWADTQAPTVRRYSGSHSGQTLRLTQWADTHAHTEGRY